MQIVIKLSDKIYDTIVNDLMPTNDEMKVIVQRIYEGIPLPNGHGDLIDRRELKKEVYTTTEWNGDVHRIIYEASVDDASIIIEADKEE